MSWRHEPQISIHNSKKGRQGFSLPNLDVPLAVPTKDARKSNVELPELSELEVVRHYTNLSYSNFSIDAGMYPLGSCTMKYNPRVNEVTASNPDFNIHPLCPDHLAQGALELIYRIENVLAEISGFARISMQPGAGAQGEYAGIRMIRECLSSRGELEKRRKILIPESAHGTNPATAAMCGFEVVPVKAGPNGILETEEIDRLSREGDVAGLMITNPNTVGLFETNIKAITDLLHERGGLVYCDGANLNAVLGITRPGDWGVDVMHFNLHKTFTTPHGGGGPGCGAVGVSKTLVPFLPVPRIERNLNKAAAFQREYESAESIGKVKAYFGHFLMMVRAYTYIRELGAEGIKKVGEDAVLLANLIRVRLTGAYNIAFDKPCMHEVIFNDKKQNAAGIKTMDIAKRIIDLGFHPPTVYFPLIVPGALMIEPTETESIENVEALCEAFLQIAKEAAEPGGKAKYFDGSPKTTPITRVDETLAVRNLVLTWKDL
jgi:glycine dehydrogenase subunit 2